MLNDMMMTASLSILAPYSPDKFSPGSPAAYGSCLTDFFLQTDSVIIKQVHQLFSERGALLIYIEVVLRHNFDQWLYESASEDQQWVNSPNHQIKVHACARGTQGEWRSHVLINMHACD